MDQEITNQEKTSTTQAQSMTIQANLDIVTRANQQVGTMNSSLRDFTTINPPTFYVSKAKEDPQEFIYEIYKIFYAMELTTSIKAEFST